MTTPLDPATLRTIADEYDTQREQETCHARLCGCGVLTMHTVRAAQLGDLASRLRTRALRVELAAKEAQR